MRSAAIHLHLRRRGFTLLEAVLAIMVIGIMAGATVPIMTRLTDAMLTTKIIQKDADRIAFAMERIQRFLRGIAVNQTTGVLQCTLDSYSNPTKITDTTTGGVLQVDVAGEVHLMENAALSSVKLLESDGDDGIGFKLIPLKSDGTSALSQPELHTFVIELKLNNFQLNSMAFPRSRLLGN